MKKTIIASVVALSALGMSNAFAANGEVQFLGAVTATTCDLTPEVGGSVTSLVQLGTAAVSGKATPVKFTLKADSAAGCTSLDNTKVADITWGGQFNATGLENQGGSATGSWVKLSTVNSKTTPVVNMTTSKLTADFAGDEIKTNGAQFTAELNGGTVAGDFKSAAAFVVAYK